MGEVQAFWGSAGGFRIHWGASFRVRHPLSRTPRALVLRGTVEAGVEADLLRGHNECVCCVGGTGGEAAVGMMEHSRIVAVVPQVQP
jgi:hypothetical protein